MEIVNAFDTYEGLIRFKEWAKAPDLLLENVNLHYYKIN
jgi:hypothetical protein